MVYDIIKKGVAVLNEYSEPSLRLKKDEDLKCEDPKFGGWLDDFELPALLEQLRSSDDYFFRKYPFDRTFILKERKIFADQLEEHRKTCKHCSAKVKEDENWEMFAKPAVDNPNMPELKTPNSPIKKIKEEKQNKIGKLLPEPA